MLASRPLSSMSDVEGTVVDSDDEPVGVDLEPADRLFAAEEFFFCL